MVRRVGIVKGFVLSTVLFDLVRLFFFLFFVVFVGLEGENRVGSFIFFVWVDFGLGSVCILRRGGFGIWIYCGLG